MSDFPKRHLVHLHSDRDRMYEIGERIGLSGEALSLFRHALCEITVIIDVNEDGTYKLIHVEE